MAEVVLSTNATNSQTHHTVHVGMLLQGTIQLLDTGAVDLFGMLMPEYLRFCGISEAIVAEGVEMEIHYIAEGGPGSHADLTAAAKYVVTDSLESVGKLDYLIVPGFYPSYQITPAVRNFIRSKLTEVRVLFGVCTGTLALLQANVLDGKIATAPRDFLPLLRSKYPGVKWQEKRWVQDEEGKIWTSGGVTNGIDMIAAFIKERFSPALAGTVCQMADVGDRGQDYN